MWDKRNFKGEMRDENRTARPGYAQFRKRDRGWDVFRRDHNSSSYESHNLSDIKKGIYLPPKP